MDAMTGTVRTLLASLVKAALMSDDRTSLLWREEAARALAALRKAPEAVAGLTLDGLWVLAVEEAEAPELREAEGRVAFGLPVRCPFSFGEILAPGFEIDEAVERIARSAATG